MDALDFEAIAKIRRKRAALKEASLKFKFPLACTPAQEVMDRWIRSPDDFLKRLRTFVDFVMQWPLMGFLECPLCENSNKMTCCYKWTLAHSPLGWPHDQVSALLHYCEAFDLSRLVARFYWDGLVKYMRRIGWGDFQSICDTPEESGLGEARQKWDAARFAANKWNCQIVSGVDYSFGSNGVSGMPKCFFGMSQRPEFKWRMQCVRMLKRRGAGFGACLLFLLFRHNERSFEVFREEEQKVASVFYPDKKEDIEMTCAHVAQCDLCPYKGDGLECQAHLLRLNPKAKSPRFQDVGIKPLAFVDCFDGDTF